MKRADRAEWLGIRGTEAATSYGEQEGNLEGGKRNTSLLKLPGQAPVLTSYLSECSGGMAVKLQKLCHVLLRVRFVGFHFALFERWSNPAVCPTLAVQPWGSLRDGPSMETV